MKKIIIVAKPFSAYQKIFVYDNENKIESVEVKYDELSDTLFAIADKYQIDKVDLTGPKLYVKGLAKQFEKTELVKYNKNSISFKVI